MPLVHLSIHFEIQFSIASPLHSRFGDVRQCSSSPKKRGERGVTSQPLGLTWETLDYKPHFSDFDWSAESCQQHAKEAYSLDHFQR